MFGHSVSSIRTSNSFYLIFNVKKQICAPILAPILPPRILLQNTKILSHAFWASSRRNSNLRDKMLQILALHFLSVTLRFSV
jgi:hypothetical protein